MASLKYVVVFSLIIMMLAHSYADEPNEFDDPNSKDTNTGVVKRSPDQEPDVELSHNPQKRDKKSGSKGGYGHYGG